MKKRILIAALTAAMASSIFGVTVNAAERELNINWLSSRSASESAILAIQDIAKQYQEENPDLDFNFEIENISDRTAYLQKLKILAASDELPEWFDSDPDTWFADIVADGKAYSFEDLYKELGMYDQIFPISKEYARLSDGSLNLMTLQCNTEYFFYNKDLFDAAGVAYPEDGMTMAEYHELAAKMTSGEGNDKVYGAHVHTWPSNVYNYPNRTGKFNFTDPETYANLTDYYNEILAMQDEGLVQDYGVLKSSNIHYSGVFYNQQAAMLQIGTWYINMLCENVKDFNWGVCALPNNDGIKNENSVGGVTPVSIGAYAKHPAEAWQFITFVCGEEGAETLAKCGVVPGYNSDKVGEIFDSLHDQYPNAPEGLSKYLGCENKLMEQPINAKGKEIDSVIQEEHSAIMTKSITVEEGLKEMTDRVKEVLAQ